MSAIEQVFRAPKLDSTRTKIVKRDDTCENTIRRCARLYVRGKYIYLIEIAIYSLLIDWLL